MVLPGHRLGKDGHEPGMVYLMFFACYILSQVSACPSTSCVTISVGTAEEQQMDTSQRRVEGRKNQFGRHQCNGGEAG